MTLLMLWFDSALSVWKLRSDKMPRIQFSDTPYKALIILINGYLALNKKHLEDVMHCSYNKAHSRLRDPATFTLQELRTIARSLGIPIEELRAAIPY